MPDTCCGNGHPFEIALLKRQDANECYEDMEVDKGLIIKTMENAIIDRFIAMYPQHFLAQWITD